MVDIPPGQFLRQLPLAIVRVKRAAAMLVGRSDHLATISGKDFGRVAIDVTEDQVLGAAGEQRDSVTTNPLSTSHRRNQVLGPLGLHRWGHGFQFPQTPRQQPSQAQSPYCRLKPQALPKLHHSAQELQPVQVHEEPPKTQGPDQRPTRCGQHPRGLRLSPRPLEEFRVVHPRRTGRHASQTSETIIHLVGEGLGRLQTIIGNRAHEGDPTPRRMPFEFRCVVGGTRRKTQPAMHALLDDRVIQSLEVRGRRR